MRPWPLQPAGRTTRTKNERRVTQPWAAYNAAQVNEGDLFATLLRDLCDTVPQPPQANGRPRLPLSDMLYGDLPPIGVPQIMRH